jgi:hypothetical protein
MQATVPPSTPLEPGYAQVRRLDLQRPFHSKAPWSVYVLTPTGEDAETGDKPVKVCFQQSPAAEPACTAFTSEGDDSDLRLAYQALGGWNDRAPSANGLRIEDFAAGVKGVVGEATYSGGGSGTLTQTVVWTFSGGRIEGFYPTYTAKISNLAEARRFASGPMAGYYITADFIWGDHETHWDPHRFTLDAYKLDNGRTYLRVLSYVTTNKYPAERQTQDYVIDHEMPHLQQLLADAYRKGPPL